MNDKIIIKREIIFVPDAENNLNYPQYFLIMPDGKRIDIEIDFKDSKLIMEELNEG